MSIRVAIQPRLLTRPQAAAYCGISVGAFDATCPVAVITLGPDKRLERYDVHALDEWIDRMRNGSTAVVQNWLDRV